MVVEKFGTSNKWIWDIEKFIDRKACMSEMYLEFKEHGKVAIEYTTFQIINLRCFYFILDWRE